MQKETNKVVFGDADYNDFVKKFRAGNSRQLVLFIGLYEPDKKKALRDIAESTDLEVVRFDFNDLVSKIESETFENFDKAFEALPNAPSILYFSNGDKLCGAYTGFTHSKVKYATPQERYFLRKVRKYRGLIVIDITETDSADETIKRAADAVVHFPLPNSTIRRILWHIKHYSLHGYDIKTKRPESYADRSANI